MRRSITTSALLVSIAVIVGVWAVIAIARPTRLVANNMNGAKEVSPEGERGVGDPDGSGRAVIRVDPAAGTICFNVSWTGIAPPSMAHIHDGTRDVAGPVIHPLWMTGDEAAEGDQDLPDTIDGVRGCLENIPRDQANELRRNPSAFYVNVHNDDFPGGAIRAQLRRPRR